MSSRVSKEKKEPPRARRASERNKQKVGMGDIKEAFKMAASNQDKKFKKIAENEQPQQLEQNTTSETTGSFVEKQSGMVGETVASSLPSSQNGSQSSLGAFSNNSIEVTQAELLSAIKELTEKVSTLDDTLNHPDKGLATQVLNLTLRCDNFHSDLHGDTEGLMDKMENCQDRVSHVENAQARISTLLAKNKRLAQDLLTTQGLLQKYSQKMKAMENKILDLTRQGTEQNEVIHGIEECDNPKNEIPFESAIKFVHEQMGLADFDENDIWKAYRFGQFRPDKARPMFLKLSYYGKDYVMDHVSNLKGKRNKHHQAYFVSEQVPEGFTEMRKQTLQTARLLSKKRRAKTYESTQTSTGHGREDCCWRGGLQAGGCYATAI